MLCEWHLVFWVLKPCLLYPHRKIMVSLNFQIKPLRRGSCKLMLNISSSTCTRKLVTSVERLPVQQLVTSCYLMSRRYQDSLHQWDFCPAIITHLVLFIRKIPDIYLFFLCILSEDLTDSRPWYLWHTESNFVLVDFVDALMCFVFLLCYRALTRSTWRYLETATRNWAASRSGSALASSPPAERFWATRTSPWLM